MTVEIKPEVLQPKEIWKAVGSTLYDSMPDRYLVSSYGRLFDKNTGKTILGNISGGYHHVSIRKSDDSSSFSVPVHRLVAEVFCYRSSITKIQVHHIDENKSNNKSSNLKWVTPLEHAYENDINTRKNEKLRLYFARLNKDDESQIDKIYYTEKEIDEEGIFEGSNVSGVCLGRYPQHGGYKWISGKSKEEVKFKALYGEYRKTEYDWVLATTKGYLYNTRRNKVVSITNPSNKYGLFANIYSKELFNNSKHGRRVSVKSLIAKAFYPDFDKYHDAVVCLDGNINNLNIDNLVVAKGARNGFVLDKYLYNRNHHQGELNEVVLKDLVYTTGRG